MEKTELNDELEIDLSELFKLLKKNIKLIIILVLAGITIAVFITTFFIDKKYASQGSILLKAEVVDGSIDSSQLNANNMMVNNYIELLQGNTIQNKVADNLNITGDEVNAALKVTNTAETQIIEIYATTTNPELSKNIVEETITVFTTLVQEKLNVTNLTIVDQPEINTNPVSPSMSKNILIGGIIGVIISLAYILLAYLLDTKIKNGEQAEQILGVPLLGTIPYFDK